MHQAELEEASSGASASLPSAADLAEGISDATGQNVTVTGVTITIVDDPAPVGTSDGDDDSGGGGGGGANTGAIVGGVVGGLAGLALIGFIVWHVSSKSAAAAQVDGGKRNKQPVHV